MKDCCVASIAVWLVDTIDGGSTDGTDKFLDLTRRITLSLVHIDGVISLRNRSGIDVKSIRHSTGGSRSPYAVGVNLLEFLHVFKENLECLGALYSSPFLVHVITKVMQQVISSLRRHLEFRCD